MFKRIAIVLIIILAILNLAPQQIFSKAKPKKSTLIIYQNEKVFGYKDNIINHLKELLYAFSEKVDKISILDFEKGVLQKYDSIIIANIEDEITNKELLQELSNYNKNIFWIGNRLEDYLDYSNKYNIKLQGQNNNITNLTYKEKDYKLKSGYLYNIVSSADNAKIISTMSDGYNVFPYIIAENNLYYISRLDLEQAYIFDNVLNDFYDVKEFNKGKIFVRIEDVHPFRDLEELKKVADYLYSEDVPFMVALIPAYINPVTEEVVTLNEVKDFAETVRYMQEKGASIILHGYTHQIGIDEVTGEGYEFWDIEKDVPIDENIEKYVKDRVLSGLRLCIENEIYPLAFEAPHYAMNDDGYKEIKKYFSTYVGQYQNNNERFTTSTFPYIITNSETFNMFIPENLGYIEENNPLSVEKIKDNYNKLSIVRGYTGGFFYHPYLDIQYLIECISYFKEKNVDFLDLKSLNNFVKIDDISIISSDGIIDCTYDVSKSITKEVNTTTLQKAIKSINNIVIFFIIIVLIIFLVIFVIFRKINTNKLKRR